MVGIGKHWEDHTEGVANTLLLACPTFYLRFWSHWEDWGRLLGKKTPANTGGESDMAGSDWSPLSQWFKIWLYHHTSSYCFRETFFSFSYIHSPTVILWTESSMYNHHPFLNYSRALIQGLTKLNSIPKIQALSTQYCKVQWLTSYCLMGHLVLPKVLSKISPYTWIFTCLGLNRNYTIYIV